MTKKQSLNVVEKLTEHSCNIQELSRTIDRLANVMTSHDEISQRYRTKTDGNSVAIKWIWGALTLLSSIGVLLLSLHIK